MGIKEDALELHRQSAGKIEICSKVPVRDGRDLSLAYTPGVAEPCLRIHEQPEMAYEYTSKGNLVAVVTDGSRVLGLGDIGPIAGLPVMEGKAVLFKTFAGVDAFPLCLDTRDPDEFVKTVKMVAPVFGGINLEDIATPRCYDIEERLRRELNIPVFHDDQHGTAVVAAAAVLGALRLAGKQPGRVRIVVNGAGAAGTAITRLLVEMNLGEVTLCDRAGILHDGMEGLNDVQRTLASALNPSRRTGTLYDAVQAADVLIGASAADAFTPTMIGQMAAGACVFALANPEPEIAYAKARSAGARVAGTGRSDAPNQVNNVLVFPGLFRGALDVRAREVNAAMKIAAARAISALIADDELRDDYVIPGPFDPRVAPAVAAAVAESAVRTGVARLTRTPEEVADHTRRVSALQG